ncbi:hypothetical protein [Calderihabitans maritimus]|uniref:Uncharacterized protein n=1 Tax=Calderihabitans maritimus TaxID=1246530 RepID=A0A1Z5HSE8_9FIRM|nr:hypothetical protein [Calderihabitans maritimus]GAW92444.1 hypothetical protein KKC1_15980 [Calderihabitans maritimus]
MNLWQGVEQKFETRRNTILNTRINGYFKKSPKRWWGDIIWEQTNTEIITIFIFVIVLTAILAWKKFENSRLRISLIIVVLGLFFGLMVRAPLKLVITEDYFLVFYPFKRVIVPWEQLETLYIERGNIFDNSIRFVFETSNKRTIILSKRDFLKLENAKQLVVRQAGLKLDHKDESIEVWKK